MKVYGSSRHDAERGAILIVFSLLLVAMMIIVGLVIDYGAARLNRQSNKRSADLAVAAGAQMWAADGVARPFQAVCEAYRYLRSNSTDMGDLSGSLLFGDETTPVSGLSSPGDPCTAPIATLNVQCSVGDVLTWAVFKGVAKNGQIDVEIRSGYSMPDARFAEDTDALAGDDGNPCHQVGVIVTERETTTFGRVTGTDEVSTRIRSVVRANIQNTNDALVALLLLEQHDCRAAYLQGNSSATLRVDGNGPRPGIIHSDSVGDGDDCGSSQVLQVDGGSTPRIVAGESETAPQVPGIITVRALNTDEEGATPSKASSACPTFVIAEGPSYPGDLDDFECPSPGDLITRSPIDERYREHMIDLRADASTRMGWNVNTARSNGFTPVGCDLLYIPDPSVPGDANLTPLADDKIFVDCPGGLTLSTSTTFGPATDPEGDNEVILNGPLSVSAVGTVISFPNVRTLYVRGSVGGAGLTTSRAVDVNHAGEASCTARTAAVPGETTKMVIGDGPLVAEGGAPNVRLCSTTLLMANLGDADCAIPGINGTAPNEAADCRGYIRVAGSGALDWTAPNEEQDTPTDFSSFEDLAFWTETGLSSADNDFNRIEGNGGVTLAGVFGTMNANPFRIGGNGAYDIENAQFFTRKLNPAGGGILLMKPDPRDVVPVPHFRGFSLVR